MLLLLIPTVARNANQHGKILPSYKPQSACFEPVQPLISIHVLVSAINFGKQVVTLVNRQLLTWTCETIM